MIELLEYDIYIEDETSVFAPASDEEVNEIVDFYWQMGVANQAELDVYREMWSR